MKELVSKVNECKLPMYMEDILTNNYCPNFLRMSMVREDHDYRFSYKTERYTRLDINRLNTYDKLILLRSIISLNERNEDWLIKAENYKLDPSLIYSLNNNVEEGCIRLLFYPDDTRTSFRKKIVSFAEAIKNKRNRSETELLDDFKSVCTNSDWNRTRLFLDKNILRMRNRSEYRS